MNMTMHKWKLSVGAAAIVAAVVAGVHVHPA